MMRAMTIEEIEKLIVERIQQCAGWSEHKNTGEFLEVDGSVPVRDIAVAIQEGFGVK